MTAPIIDLVTEYSLTEKMKSELAQLLTNTFPDTKHYGRHYFKQLPHSRLVATVDGNAVGQVAMDYRAMNLNGSLIHVLGVIDLAVSADHRGKGMGIGLMQRLEQIAFDNKGNIDFIFLVTDIPSFYEKLGYKQTTQKVTWMKIYESKTYGLGNEQVDDCYLMYKAVSGKLWQDGNLDMLGYWY